MRVFLIFLRINKFETKPNSEITAIKIVMYKHTKANNLKEGDVPTALVTK